MTRFREYLDEWHLYLGPLMLVPMVTLPWVVFDRRVRFFLVCFVVVMTGSTVMISFQPPYWASLTGVVWVLLVQCLQYLRVAGGRRHSASRAMVALIPWMVLVSIAGWQLERALATPENTHYRHKQRRQVPDRLQPVYQRHLVAQRLEAMEGHHLVLLRYGESHIYHFDWVYNGVNIND